MESKLVVKAEILIVYYLLFMTGSDTNTFFKKVNIKVQEEPQAELAANPWNQKEGKKWHKLTCAQLTNKCTTSTKSSSLLPKQGDQNAKRTEETSR